MKIIDYDVYDILTTMTIDDIPQGHSLLVIDYQSNHARFAIDDCVALDFIIPLTNIECIMQPRKADLIIGRTVSKLGLDVDGDTVDPMRFISARDAVISEMNDAKFSNRITRLLKSVITKIKSI